MPTKLILFLAVFSGILLSCTNNGSTVTTTDTTETDTVNYALDTDSALRAINPTRPPDGIYSVLLPCADCKGIEHTVLFNPDLTYRLEVARLVKNRKIPTYTNGNWKPLRDTIWLYQTGQQTGRYTWRGDTLLYIPASGQPVALQKKQAAAENEVWKKKGAAGTDFFGVGNEPFWNIEIDTEKGIAFHLAEWPQPVQLKPAQPIIGTDSTVYTTGNDSIQLKVTIYNTFCSDGMSDYTYTHKVKVAYNKQVYSGCGIVYQ